MGVSKNRGSPKWMVKIVENPYFLMDDLGGKPHYFRKHPHDMVDFYGFHVGKYTVRPMDPMGFNIYCYKTQEI